MEKIAKKFRIFTKFVFTNLFITLILFCIGLILNIPDDTLYAKIVLFDIYFSVICAVIWVCNILILIKKEIYILNYENIKRIML